MGSYMALVISIASHVHVMHDVILKVCRYKLHVAI